MSELEKVIEEMKVEAGVFMDNCDDSTKAAGARARKATMNFRKLGKRFRKLSVAAEKK